MLFCIVFNIADYRAYWIWFLCEWMFFHLLYSFSILSLFHSSFDLIRFLFNFVIALSPHVYPSYSASCCCCWFSCTLTKRCKSRYCTKSLWHEYWTEIFKTWSKYRTKLSHNCLRRKKNSLTVCIWQVALLLTLLIPCYTQTHNISQLFNTFRCFVLPLFQFLFSFAFPNQNYWVEWNP